jgi:hypothetical protein
VATIYKAQQPMLIIDMTIIKEVKEINNHYLDNRRVQKREEVEVIV